jgi:hypothetical protein
LRIRITLSACANDENAKYAEEEEQVLGKTYSSLKLRFAVGRRKRGRNATIGLGKITYLQKQVGR